MGLRHLHWPATTSPHSAPLALSLFHSPAFPLLSFPPSTPQHLQWCTVSADCFTSTLALFNEISKSFNRCIWSTRRETPTYSSALLCCKVHFGSDVLMHENVIVTLLRRVEEKRGCFVYECAGGRRFMVCLAWYVLSRAPHMEDV